MNEPNERRVYSRIRCAGNASIRQPEGASAWPAKIVELSAGGCLLQVEGLGLAGLACGDQVELTLRADEKPLLLGAELRSQRGAEMLGFRFQPMSLEQNGRLEEILQEMDKSCG